MKISKIVNPDEKSQVCNSILRSLPKWFGIESAILDYVNDVKKMDTWVVESEEKPVGFISINKHNPKTAEIHVMGILEDHHHKGIGKFMIETVESELHKEGIKCLTVKTLSENRPDENYDKTRQFYIKMGFTPIEEFKTLWGEHNPCLMLIKAIEPNATNFKGMIVEESLKDPRIINKLSISSVEITSPSHWHIYTFSINEGDILNLQNFIKEGPWYIHFWNSKEIIVVFKEKIFRFLRTDRTTWEQLTTYGREMGIPGSQLDFKMD